MLLFDQGIPEKYNGDIDNPLLIKKWLNEQIRSNLIEQISDLQLMRKVVKRSPALAILIVEDFQQEVSGQDELQVIKLIN